MGNGQSAFARPESLTWGISDGADAGSGTVVNSHSFGRLPGPFEVI
ncbi:MAG: hypothetical protein FWG02_11455 [Holophagaceae bacterium]|nr:hypothetical protein [Holophagaceae bacterium]